LRRGVGIQMTWTWLANQAVQGVYSLCKD
jgi:hypothetical protein